MHSNFGIDILMIGNDAELLMALQEAGFAVEAITETQDLYDSVARLRPAAVLLRTDSPTRDSLEHLASLGQRYPQPTLLFHDGQNESLTREAIELGICAYVAEGMSPTALRSLIEVASAHYSQLRALRKELTRSQQSLAERKRIDAAKCVLMERKGLSEAKAYQCLREQAMNARRSMDEMAREVLANTEKTR